MVPILFFSDQEVNMNQTLESQGQSPREVFIRYHEFVREYNVEKVVAFFAETGRWEIPFAPKGFASLLSGREEIRTFLTPMYRRAKESGRRILGYDSFVIYETSDPELIISEFSIQGESGTGEKYQRAFVQIARITEGRIVLLRDYFDAAGMTTLPKSKE
jgi:ketosteroid isomerase-like protein